MRFFLIFISRLDTVIPGIEKSKFVSLISPEVLLTSLTLEKTKSIVGPKKTIKKNNI